MWRIVGRKRLPPPTPRSVAARGVGVGRGALRSEKHNVMGSRRLPARRNRTILILGAYLVFSHRPCLPVRDLRYLSNAACRSQPDCLTATQRGACGLLQSSPRQVALLAGSRLRPKKCAIPASDNSCNSRYAPFPTECGVLLLWGEYHVSSNSHPVAAGGGRRRYRLALDAQFPTGRRGPRHRQPRAAAPDGKRHAPGVVKAVPALEVSSCSVSMPTASGIAAAMWMHGGDIYLEASGRNKDRSNHHDGLSRLPLWGLSGWHRPDHIVG
jgi:hypothetical protein